MLDLTHRKKVVIGGAPTPTYIVVDNYSDECQLLKMETKRFFMLRKGKLYKFKVSLFLDQDLLMRSHIIDVY